MSSRRVPAPPVNVVIPAPRGCPQPSHFPVLSGDQAREKNIDEAERTRSRQPRATPLPGLRHASALSKQECLTQSVTDVGEPRPTVAKKNSTVKSACQWLTAQRIAVRWLSDEVLTIRSRHTKVAGHAPVSAIPGTMEAAGSDLAIPECWLAIHWIRRTHENNYLLICKKSMMNLAIQIEIKTIV